MIGTPIGIYAYKVTVLLSSIPDYFYLLLVLLVIEVHLLGRSYSAIFHPRNGGVLLLVGVGFFTLLVCVIGVFD